MQMNPAWNDGLQGSISRDVSLAIPVRRASFSSSNAPQLLPSPTSILFSASEDNIILSHCSRTERGKIKKRVRFAPRRSNPTTTIMSLDDYTTKEHEACWYSRQEFNAMLHQSYSLHRDSRWNAGAALDHMYERKMWSQISSMRTRFLKYNKQDGCQNVGMVNLVPSKKGGKLHLFHHDIIRE